ncbi:MAG TPA: M23 family metallopeptidase [Candidatus Methylomirabilis sp.]|nr:M23 family metallopeptidase [Candidatus Methylomirabilis sp.]
MAAVVGLVAILTAPLMLQEGNRPGSSSTPTPPPPISSTLGKGRTFLDALLAHGLPQDLAARLVQAFRPLVNFRRLRPGDSLEFHRDASGDMTRVVYRQSPIDIVEATPAGDTWTATRRDVPVERRIALVAGTLEGNLFESMEGLGEGPQLVLDFAEIFAWDFDFAADSQPGDRFRMLVEKVLTGDQFVRYGRILAAAYESEGKVHTGVYFQEREGGGYYTPAGESLRRAFLKSPLEFTRISSGYSHGRLHPILGGVRPHLAVDYAAPSGTPVWAVADGSVEHAGWSGGNGNTVILRHRANFKTMYNHLSRFGKGIRAGASVRQRQVIGYVGSTGLSTGPHLDYRVIRDGRFVNPLKQTFLPGKPISPSARSAFLETRDSLLRQLQEGDAARLAAAPNS